MIEIKNIVKKFGDFTALNDISFNVPDGCIYGVVGSNGAGKSTLLRIITGVYKPDAGEVIIDGKKVYENPEAKAITQFVPDDLFFLTGADMDRMAKMYASMFDSFDYKRYEELAKSFGLDRKKSISMFSKGMRRQVTVILSLSCHPKYLFFDESFDGLDPIMRSHVKKLICEDVADNGATAVITSHSLRELEDTCDQIALLHKGGLILQNDIQNLKTTRFKVQIAFSEDYGRDKFNELNISEFTKVGSVANIIVNGSREDTVAKLNAMKPLLLDILPLTLEEIFAHEMDALGYSFDVREEK